MLLVTSTDVAGVLSLEAKSQHLIKKVMMTRTWEKPSCCIDGLGGREYVLLDVCIISDPVILGCVL